MKEVQDTIFINSGQGKTYYSINVKLFIGKMAFPSKKYIINQLLSEAEFIRIATVQVKEEKVKHFEEMQRNVWNIGMSKAEGMLGGTFASSLKEDNSFLVLSGWENEGVHQSYVDNILPELLTSSNSKMDVLNIEGEQFKLEETWSVVSQLKK
jgi:quinol monooxygenase YgiN